MRIKQKRFLRNSDTPSVYHGSVCQSRIFSLAAAFVDLWAIDLESGFKLVATAMTSASYRPDAAGRTRRRVCDLSTRRCAGGLRARGQHASQPRQRRRRRFSDKRDRQAARIGDEGALVGGDLVGIGPNKAARRAKGVVQLAVRSQ